MYKEAVGCGNDSLFTKTELEKMFDTVRKEYATKVNQAKQEGRKYDRRIGNLEV